MVLQLLDRPIAFHRCFVPVAESVAGAVWLSQLVYWSGRGQDKTGWIYKTQQEWKEETGLGRSEQENVRKKLRNKMVLEEKEDGLPCRLFYRLNLDRLFELISSQSCADAGADQYAGIQHTRMRKTSKQACGNLANKDDGNQQANTETTHRSHHKPPPHAQPDLRNRALLPVQQIKLEIAGQASIPQILYFQDQSGNALDSAMEIISTAIKSTTVKPPLAAKAAGDSATVINIGGDQAPQAVTPKPAKVIRAADYSSKSYLESEAEVEEYITKLKAELMAAIKAGQRARIQ